VDRREGGGDDGDDGRMWSKCCVGRASRNTQESNEEETDDDVYDNDLTLMRRQNSCPCPCLPRSQSLRLDSIPMRSMDGGDSVVIGSSIITSAQKNRRVRRHPLIPSKTVVEEEPSKSSYLSNFLNDNKKANSVACLAEARLICRHKLLQTVPNKMSETGVRVFYLCDDDSYKRAVEESSSQSQTTYNKTGIVI
jgi:hypothetical protein